MSMLWTFDESFRLEQIRNNNGMRKFIRRLIANGLFVDELLKLVKFSKCPWFWTKRLTNFRFRMFSRLLWWRSEIDPSVWWSIRETLWAERRFQVESSFGFHRSFVRSELNLSNQKVKSEKKNFSSIEEKMSLFFVAMRTLKLGKWAM